MSTIPTSTSEITTEWMTETLRTGGAISPSTSVSGIERDPMGAGVGFMGEVGRLHLTYEGGRGPESVICKIPTQDPNVRGLLAAARVFEREARFYLDVAPHLDVVPQAHAVVADFAADE